MTDFDPKAFVEEINILRKKYIKSSYTWFTTPLKPRGVGSVSYYHLIKEAYVEDDLCVIPMNPIENFDKNIQEYPVNLINMQHSLEHKGIVASIDYNAQSICEEFSFSKAAIHVPETSIETLVKIFADCAVENLRSKDFEVASGGKALRLQNPASRPIKNSSYS